MCVYLQPDFLLVLFCSSRLYSMSSPHIKSCNQSVCLCVSRKDDRVFMSECPFLKTCFCNKNGCLPSIHTVCLWVTKGHLREVVCLRGLGVWRSACISGRACCAALEQGWGYLCWGHALVSVWAATALPAVVLSHGAGAEEPIRAVCSPGLKKRDF